jgi:heptosyltransferase-2
MPEAAASGRVVVRAPNWLGDAVLALPAMAALRRHFAGAHVVVAATPSVAALFREITAAAPDDVLELAGGSRASTAALRSGRFDTALLLPNSFRSAWQVYRAGVPERWGYAAAGRGPLLTRRARRPRRGDVRHQADYYRELVRRLGVTAGDEAPRVTPAEGSAAQARALAARHGFSIDRPFVAMLPGAAYGQAKQWPPDRMADLSARIARTTGAPSVLAGAPHDRPAGRAIESWLRAHAPDAAPAVRNLVGETTLGALAGLLARATVCVSNDSGGMHLASAVGCPVVAIFGPTDERATGPCGPHDLVVEPVFCRPCLLRDCPIDHRCMRRIAVDRVAPLVLRRLEGAV